jgi:CheY-like chemotaxis protein
VGPLQSNSQGFSGTINLQLTDLIQMVCLSRSDITILVKSSKGSGKIFVKDGQICHVQTEVLEGEPALFQLFQWKDGQFEVLPFEGVDVTSVDKSWEYLILEAMRLRDEEASVRVAESPLEDFDVESSTAGELVEQDPTELRLALDKVLSSSEPSEVAGCMHSASVQLIEGVLSSPEEEEEGFQEKSLDDPITAERGRAGLDGEYPGVRVPGELDAGIDKAFDITDPAHRLELPPKAASNEIPVQPHVILDTRVRILVVDDSSFFARQLKRTLEADPNIQVVGTAKNGKECLEFLAAQPAVDLITLDVQMPVMKGDTTLKNIMIRHPIPVLMISSFQTESLSKIFEFLQVGAIDFISKPEAQEDIVFYGKRLRDVVKRAARSEVSHFKRWRKPKTTSPCSSDFDPSADRVLVILGAEGAYMDWFRLPLPHLCRHGLVVGLQKISDLFVGRFCQLIEEGTCAKTQPLWHSEWVSPGKFYFGNGGLNAEMKLLSGPLSLGIEVASSDGLSWYEGAQLCLKQLAGQARERMSVYFLSGAHCLEPEVIEDLAGHGAQMILSPQDTVMCTDLVESISAYSKRYPKQIVWASPENLMEVWSKYEPDA